MDLNNDMELDNYEVTIGNVYEGADANINAEAVTEDMARMAIAARMKENRKVTSAVSMAIYSDVKDKIVEYENKKEMGR